MKCIAAVCAFFSLFITSNANAQLPDTGRWHVTLSRPGGLPVYFTMELSYPIPQHPQLGIINAGDTMLVDQVVLQGDSIFFETPVFESGFRARMVNSSHMKGHWIKGTAAGAATWDFEAFRSEQPRIPGPAQRGNRNISGRWQMNFVRKDGSIRKSVGELVQQRNRLTGTILNPSGDYRFLEGVVRGDSMYLTTFDGSHSYAIVARLPNDTVMTDGLFFGGTAPGEKFTAAKNAQARLDNTIPTTRSLEPKPISFSFPDIDGKTVSLSDERFKGKVVIVQLMGSWCPNCMDETKYLSGVYNSRKWQDVEMVALAYELTTDFNRSAVSIRKFQQKFSVKYPMLVTGVTSSDPHKGHKTLPAFGEIRYFPTTLFIDKQGRLRKVHEGFYGPGAPDYFEAFQEEFNETVESLRKE